MSTVIFVCLGNICRSPMAERMLVRRLEDELEAGRGIDVTVTSAGVSAEEAGNPMDDRAVRQLTGAGYSAEGHTAHQITREEIESADLLVAMEERHLGALRRIAGRDVDNAVLLTDFDPEASPGDPVPDPWYGGPEGFETTMATIERALPGILERLRES